MFIEAERGAFQRLQRKYESRDGVLTLCETVATDNVNAILGRASVPAEVDVLAIDIDGRDYWIWRALEHMTPKLVVMEYNARFGPGESRTIPADDASMWDGTDCFGASLTALNELAEARGFRLVHTDQSGTNAFYVRADLLGACPDPDVVPIAPPNYLLVGLSHLGDPRRREFVTPPPPQNCAHPPKSVLPVLPAGKRW